MTRKESVALLFFAGLFVFLGAKIAFAFNIADQADNFYQDVCLREKNLAGLVSFVCDLRARIDNIPTGPVGPAGPQGPQGAQGEPGLQLKVIDADDQVIGNVLDLSNDVGSGSGPYQQVRVFDTTRHIVLTLFLYNGELDDTDPLSSYIAGDLDYESTDCSDAPYVARLANPYFLVKIDSPIGTRYYKADSYSDVSENLSFHSRKVPGTSCQILDSIHQYAAKVHEIPKPVFAAPLRIVAQ